MTRSFAIVVSLILSACEGDDPLPPPLPPSAEPPAPSATVTTRPRERSYYVGNEDMVCVVFWEEGLRSSVRKTVPCPREIEPGERVRLTGRTCMREAATAERNVPIRCPKQIFYAERDDGRGKGEFKLGQKK